MSRVFRWFMRHGAAVLFTLAAISLLLGMLQAAVLALGTDGYGYSSHGPTNWAEFIWTGLSATLPMTAFCFILSLIVDRIDRWLAIRERELGR